MDFFEKLGKEIVEKLNKGESVGSSWNISSFYNIKQFHYIKTKIITSNTFQLIILPEDNDGDSLLEMKFLVSLFYSRIKLNIFLIDNKKYYVDNNKFHCFTKFNLTGNFWNDSSLDYWLVRDEKFEWILEYLKEYDPEYNLSMYELFGFNEEYVRKKY